MTSPAIVRQTQFLVALAEAGIEPDIQEVLVAGNPSRGIAPGALAKALAALDATPGEGGQAAGEPDAWMVERFDGSERRIIDARKYNASHDSFWISAEAKDQHRITPLWRPLSGSVVK